MLIAASTSVEFIFNHVMYKHIDGVARDSPLDPDLAIIISGYSEKKLF